MKRHVLVAIILGLAVMVVSAAPAMAGWAGVSQCFINGKWVTVKGNCPVSGGEGSSSTPSYDYEAERQRQEAERQRQLEAERQRQRELEEQRQREEEAAKQRQIEFEKNKEEALKSMKGITEGELGLKGADAGGLGLKDIGDTGTSGLGLKDIQTSASATEPKKADCEWGTMDSSIVDLRCLGLDPNKPISVDPNVVGGNNRDSDYFQELSSVILHMQGQVGGICDNDFYKPF